MRRKIPCIFNTNGIEINRFIWRILPMGYIDFANRRGGKIRL